MKMPKKRRMYCKHCRKHTVHKVIQNKRSRKRGALKQGQRRHKRRSGIHGYGGYPQPQQQKSHRHGRKTSHKVDLRFECSECNKKSTYKNSFRTKKFEISRLK